MSGFEVAPEELRSVGAALKTAGPGFDATAAGMAVAGGSVSDPPTTAAALDEMSAHWFAGLQRLSDDVVVFGGMAQLAANGYEVADHSSMPEVVSEDDVPMTPLTPGHPGFDPFAGAG
jgi:hypothetical protein